MRQLKLGVNMSSILEAVAKGTDLKHFNERKERAPNNFDAKKADNDLRACPVCKVVWEVMVFNQTVDYKYYHKTQMCLWNLWDSSA